MTSAAQTAHSQGHEEHHHVCSFGQFFGIYVALLFLTAVTVWVSLFDFGSLNLVIAMAVAALKAGLVMTVFMHLRWDTAINNIAFLSSVLFLSLLFLFTLADFQTRGRVDPRLAQSAPLDINGVYKTRRKAAGAEDGGSFTALEPYLTPHR